jgi:hypothetical protein
MPFLALSLWLCTGQCGAGNAHFGSPQLEGEIRVFYIRSGHKELLASLFVLGFIETAILLFVFIKDHGEKKETR